MQNLTFKIEFKNVPDSMLTAMAQMEIGDVSNIVVNFSREANFDVFTSMASLCKIANMETDIKEAMKEAISKSIDNVGIY